MRGSIVSSEVSGWRFSDLSHDVRKRLTLWLGTMWSWDESTTVVLARSCSGNKMLSFQKNLGVIMVTMMGLLLDLI